MSVHSFLVYRLSQQILLSNQNVGFIDQPEIKKKLLNLVVIVFEKIVNEEKSFKIMGFRDFFFCQIGPFDLDGITVK